MRGLPGRLNIAYAHYTASIFAIIAIRTRHQLSPSKTGLTLKCCTLEMKLRQFIIRVDRLSTGISFGIATCLLAVISCLGLWQVITRFVLSQPSIWTEEVMRRLLIWCVMLGVVVAIRQGALVSVDLMLRVSRGAWHEAVRLFITLATAGFLTTILWFGVLLTWRVRFQTFASLDISIAWAYACVPTGAALGLIALLAHYLDPPASPSFANAD
jgi:TRAP-type C4-dicarboxylate transport system permease small subunit